MPNVLENATTVGQDCFDVDHLFGTPIGQNFSYDEAKAFKCSTALIWAKEQGITNFPQYYKNYTDDGLNADSSWADFQCALYNMKGSDEAGTGWNCTYPCTSTLPQCPPPPVAPVVDKDLATVTEAPGSSSSSLAWWAWLLIGLALLGLIGGLAYMLMGGKKEAPKKKKRAVAQKKAEPPAPEVQAAPTPVAPATLTAPPVYVTQARAAPVAMTAPPVYAATTYAQPMAMAMPIQMVAAPIQTATAPMAMAAPTVTMASAFDRLDANHDGVISREEFAQFGFARP